MTMTVSIDIKGAKLVFEGSLEEITDVLDVINEDAENLEEYGDFGFGR